MKKNKDEYNYNLEIANFVFKVGKKGLLDTFEQWFYPIIEEAEIEDLTLSETNKLFFHDIHFKDYEGIPIMYGRLVREATIKSRQKLNGTELIDDNNEMTTHPSSFFVLMLDAHKLLWVREMNRAPKLSDFNSIIKRIFIKHRSRYIREELKKHKEELYIEFGKKRFKTNSKEKELFEKRKREFRERIYFETHEEINVTPISDQRQLEQKIKSLESINHLKIKLLPTNNEIANENKKFLSKYEILNQKIGSINSNVEFTGGDQTLNKEVVIDLYKNSSKGTMEAEIKGVTKEGDVVKFKNSDDSTTFKRRIENYLRKNSQNTIAQIIDMFQSVIQAKIIMLPNKEDQSKEKAQSLIKEFNKRLVRNSKKNG